MDIKTLYTLFLQTKKITTDSRNIPEDSIFFALKGENFNGNTFAREALEKGATYAIIDEEKYEINTQTILVEDVLKTLQQLAEYHRKKLGIPILSLTGSNGKTTTKELINAVLSKKFNTVATQGNLNNHIGVPLTLLAMDKTTEFGIVEMGANHQKEIAFLCNIATPDYGCITNFGKAHLEGFGGIAGVIKGKSELYDYLIKNQKFIFYNADDPIQINKLKNYNQKYSFSQQQNTGDLRIQSKATLPYISATLNNNTISSQLIGTYNFNNIAMAITIGEYFKIPREHVKQAIESYIPNNNRSQYFKKDSNTIILDAYNANPTSMKAALDNLTSLPVQNKIAFLGDMFELGSEASGEHQTIADYAREARLDNVYLIGIHFSQVQTSFKIFKTFKDFETFLKKNPLKNQTILIKGSRGMALERIVDII